MSVEGATAVLPQLVLGATWLVTCFAIWKWVGARWGQRPALIALTLLLVTDRFRDLVAWRSWMTTTGELAGMAICLWAMERGRWGAAIVAGAVACWFKEPAMLPLVAASLLIYRRPTVAVAILAAGMPGAAKAIHDAGLFNDGFPGSAGPLGNLVFYAKTSFGWVWPPAVVLLAAVGRAPSLANDVRWVVPAGLAFLPALLYPHSNPTYLLEGMLFALGPAAVVLNRVGSTAILGAGLLLSLWSLPASIASARWQALQLRDQVRIISAVNPQAVRSFALGPQPSETAVWTALILRFNYGIPERPVGEAAFEITPGLSGGLNP